MKKKTLILVGYIFCVTSFLNSCSNQIVTSQCGTSVSTELSYTGLPSDAVFPEPRVSETSYPDKIEKIRIEFNSIEPNLTDKVHLVEMETSDQGSHWSKGSEWRSAEERFFRYGPLVYKEQYPTFDDETGLVSPGGWPEYEALPSFFRARKSPTLEQSQQNKKTRRVAHSRFVRVGLGFLFFEFLCKLFPIQRRIPVDNSNYMRYYRVCT
jgi:hypothetical protein